MRPTGIISKLAALIVAFVLIGCKEQTREEREFNETAKHAESGGYHVQMLLGSYYEKGHGTEINTEKAIECYFRALMIIHSEKQKLPTTLEGWKKLASEERHERKIDYLIGLYYDGNHWKGFDEIRLENGSGAWEEDISEAVKWYMRCIKDEWAVDNPEVYMRLADLSESPKTEIGYLRTGSIKGSATAKYELAKRLLYQNNGQYIYEKGKRRVEVIGRNDEEFTKNSLNFFEGLSLMKESSELGCAVASVHLQSIYSNWRLNSPLGKDEKLAWYFRRKTEEQKLSQSYCRLWFLYWRQEPSLASMLPYSKEGVEALLKHKMGALRGDPESIFALSVCHQYGQGVPKDSDEALRLCKKSASLGYPLALLSMGNRYYDGTGVIKDEIEAYAYWNLAGVSLKEGAEYIAEMEKKLTESARLLGQKRSRELQAEIEANMPKIKSK